MAGESQSEIWSKPLTDNERHIIKGVADAASPYARKWINHLLKVHDGIAKTLQDALEGWKATNALYLAAQSELAAAIRERDEARTALQFIVKFPNGVGDRAPDAVARSVLASQSSQEISYWIGCPNCLGFGRVRDSMRLEPVVCGRCGGSGKAISNG